MPQDYVEPPEMDEWVTYYVKAFYTMSRSRPYHYGGTPGYLNLSIVRDYVAIFGPPYDLEEFIDVIFTMDVEYLPVAVQRQKTANSDKTQQRPPSARPPRR